ncbi:hypothetical protein, partial [Blautia producta]
PSYDYFDFIIEEPFNHIFTEKVSHSLVWGKNIISYMHYETTYFAVTHLLDRIKESFYSQTNNS